MTTREPAALRWLATQWEAAIDAATFAGIVGDARHRRDGGYHISREDQPASNYSVSDFSDDRLGRSDLASAVDMTMSTADMRLVTGRLAAAWAVQDPRMDHVRGFCGTTDGVHARRWDAAYSPATSAATSDHLWHIHLEIFRRWADDMDTARDVLSVITGEDDDMQQNEVMTSSRSGPASVGHVMLATYDGVELDIKPQLDAIARRLDELGKVTTPELDYAKFALALLDGLVARATAERAT